MFRIYLFDCSDRKNEINLIVIVTDFPHSEPYQ